MIASWAKSQENKNKNKNNHKSIKLKRKKRGRERSNGGYGKILNKSNKWGRYLYLTAGFNGGTTICLPEASDWVTKEEMLTSSSKLMS